MMPNTARTRWTCASLALTLATGGCSTVAPVPPWNAPDATAAGASMPGALGYLQSLRGRYRETVAAQLNDERAASNALLGAGALVAALALGKVHRDAVVGTAFLGGTGYALSQNNLQRPRLLVYQAGVEALNCAERAVTPYAISPDEQQRLGRAVTRLEGARQTLAAAIVDTQRVIDTHPGDVDLPGANAAVIAARVQLADSEKTLRAASAFNTVVTRGARDLVAAVNGIDAAVMRSLASATPDLGSVPKLVLGLAGMAAAFAPGAGVDELLTARLAAVKAGTPQSTAKQMSDVELATISLNVAVTSAQAANADAAAQLSGRSGPFPEDAFKDCGVAQVVATLAVSPQRLNFTADTQDRRYLDISGGVKPYFVEIEGPASLALTAKGPVRFDTRAELNFASGALKGVTEGTLRVSDSAPNAPNIVLVPVAVAAGSSAPGEGQTKTVAGMGTGTSPGPAVDVKKVAAPQPAVGGSGSKPAAGAAGLDTALAALKARAQFKFSGKTYTRSDVPVRDGDVLRFTVLCPSDAAPVRRVDLATAYLAEAGVTAVKPQQLAITTQPAGCATP